MNVLCHYWSIKCEMEVHKQPTKTIEMKKSRLTMSKCLVLTSFFVVLQSCYSVRIKSIKGNEQPDPISERTDDYRNMSVVEIDTTLTIKATTSIPTFLIKESSLCKSGQLHTVEYRNTLGSVLLSAVTFGRKRKMKVKYVCVKSSN